MKDNVKLCDLTEEYLKYNRINLDSDDREALARAASEDGPIGYNYIVKDSKDATRLVERFKVSVAEDRKTVMAFVKPGCDYCTKLDTLLTAANTKRLAVYGLHWVADRDIQDQVTKLINAHRRAESTTWPIVFVNGRYVGGYDDVKDADWAKHQPAATSPTATSPAATSPAATSPAKASSAAGSSEVKAPVSSPAPSTSSRPSYRYIFYRTSRKPCLVDNCLCVRCPCCGTCNRWLPDCGTSDCSYACCVNCGKMLLSSKSKVRRTIGKKRKRKQSGSRSRGKSGRSPSRGSSRGGRSPSRGSSRGGRSPSRSGNPRRGRSPTRRSRE